MCVWGGDDCWFIANISGSDVYVKSAANCLQILASSSHTFSVKAGNGPEDEAEPIPEYDQYVPYYLPP